MTVNTVHRQVPFGLQSHTTKSPQRKQQCLVRVSLQDCIFVSHIQALTSSLFSVRPLLKYPSGRFSSSAGKRNRKERKNVGLMWVHASSSRVAGTPLTPHLCNGLGTEICSFRLGGTNPESQHFWVSGRAAAFLRGITADDALCNGCNGSLLPCCTVAGMHLPHSKTN